jgi:hypothetical protein
MNPHGCRRHGQPRTCAEYPIAVAQDVLSGFLLAISSKAKELSFFALQLAS